MADVTGRVKVRKGLLAGSLAVALVASIAAMTGLALSLLVRRRRVWVRVAAGAAGTTVVDVAGLTRSEHASVAGFARFVLQLQALGAPSAEVGERVVESIPHL